MADLKYFNALMNSVVGDDEQRKAAKEYLAEVDPEITCWSFFRFNKFLDYFRNPLPTRYLFCSFLALV
jgi:hypothetical protein